MKKMTGTGGNGARPEIPASFQEFADRHMISIRREAAKGLERLVHEGRLPRRRRSVEGVVDETLLRAWERFESRPEAEGLEGWLRGLVQSVLEEAVQHASETTPEIEGHEKDEGAEEPGIFRDEEDPVIWEDLLPEKKESEPLHRTTRDEDREAILAFLGELSAADRDAFSLNTFDGYDPGEIAELQKRDRVQVERAIDEARRRLGTG